MTDLNRQATALKINDRLRRPRAERNGAADIWLDFTVPAAVFEKPKPYALRHGWPRGGTTGLSDEQVEELQQLAKQNGLGA